MHIFKKLENKDIETRLLQLHKEIPPLIELLKKIKSNYTLKSDQFNSFLKSWDSGDAYMPKSFLNEYLTEVIGMPKLSFIKSDKIDNE